MVVDQECRLCLRPRRLCRSHVIPEFVYRPMYDERHRYLVLSTDPSRRQRSAQTGVWEHLLCEECERRLSVHERYVRGLLHGGERFDGSRHGSVFTLSGLEYRHVRLFYLSVLWRMSVSQHRMFRNVDLGPRQEPLRTMVCDDDAGEPHEYGFLCTVPFIKGKVYQDLILQPERVRVFGTSAYRAVIGGLLFVFSVSKQRVPAEVERTFVQKDGTWVWFGRDVRLIPFMAQWLSAAAAANP